MLHAARSLCLTLLVLAPFASARAAAVLVVDAAGGAGADHTTIQEAVDAAANGDVILVRPSDVPYEPPLLGAKSLTLVGDGMVRIGTPTSLVATFVQDLAPGGRIVLRNFEFAGGEFHETRWPAFVGLKCSGSIWLDGCTFDAPHIAALLDKCDDVVLTRSTLTGGPALLDVTAPGQVAQDPQPALRAFTCDLSLQQSVLTGGAGVDALPMGLPLAAGKGAFGLQIDLGSAVITRSMVTGGAGGDGALDSGGVCLPPAQGAVGMILTDSHADVVDAALLGGDTGAVVGACAAPPKAPRVLVTGGEVVPLDVDVATFAASSPARPGQATTVELNGTPGSLALLFLGLDPARTWVPGVGLLHVGQPLVPIALGTIPPSGALAVTTTTPAPPVGVQALDHFLQAVTCVPGGGCAFTAPAVVTLLDATF